MKWPTHLIGGLTACALVSTEPSALIVAGAASLLPDIDKINSKIGRKLPVLSIPINIIFGHRGFTHSLLAAGLLYYLSLQFLPEYVLIVTIGYLSHLLLDSLNPMGVAWLWPLPFRLRIPLIRTGSVLENVLLVGLILVLVKGVII